MYIFIFLYIDICNYIYLDTSYHYLALSLLLKYSFLFFKYSCTNIFHRRSLCTLYNISIITYATSYSSTLMWATGALGLIYMQTSNVQGREICFILLFVLLSNLSNSRIFSMNENGHSPRTQVQCRWLDFKPTHRIQFTMLNYFPRYHYSVLFRRNSSCRCSICSITVTLHNECDGVSIVCSTVGSGAD